MEIFRNVVRSVLNISLPLWCLITQIGKADLYDNVSDESEAARRVLAFRRSKKMNSQPGASSIGIDAAVVREGWYDRYMTRETISDPVGLPVPSEANIISWKKKFLELPLPPRYTKALQTKDDYEVSEVLRGRYGQLQHFRPMLETAYIEYKRYSLDVEKVNAVCRRIQVVTQARAWKDYWERTTRVRIRANKELEKAIESIGFDVDNLFVPLVGIKKTEYEDWAKMHPQAAMNIAVKRRVAEAEARAGAAEERAKEAEDNAIAAQAEAAAAAAAAADAEFRAEEAERRQREAAARLRDSGFW